MPGAALGDSPYRSYQKLLLKTLLGYLYFEKILCIVTTLATECAKSKDSVPKSSNRNFHHHFHSSDVVFFLKTLVLRAIVTHGDHRGTNIENSQKTFVRN